MHANPFEDDKTITVDESKLVFSFSLHESLWKCCSLYVDRNRLGITMPVNSIMAFWPWKKRAKNLYNRKPRLQRQSFPDRSVLEHLFRNDASLVRYVPLAIRPFSNSSPSWKVPWIIHPGIVFICPKMLEVHLSLSTFISAPSSVPLEIPTNVLLIRS